VNRIHAQISGLAIGLGLPAFAEAGTRGANVIRFRLSETAAFFSIA
jgi:hypothetical protein